MARKKTVVEESVPLNKAGRAPSMFLLDAPSDAVHGDRGPQYGSSPLVKRILSEMGNVEKSIDRLALEQDPVNKYEYQSIFKFKNRLLPDYLIKRIFIQDDLLATILQARSNHVAAHGQEQTDRFKYGVRLQPRRGAMDHLDPSKKHDLHLRSKAAVKKILTCGDTLADGSRMSLKEFFYVQTSNGLRFGRFATELIWRPDPFGSSGTEKLFAFRPIDAGTIYRATKHSDGQDAVRLQARKILEDLKGRKMDPDRFEKGDYEWVQVMDNRPVQAFTAKECVVTTLYPTTDYELQGYPITPIDTVISHVTMHLNITAHNRLWFQAGRAARGMIVVKSDDGDQEVVKRIKAQFQSSINGVQNSWRMPVFSVSASDDVSFQSIDSTARDAEFQYLSDMNARVIMAAFMISPEELPGYQHLSKGTASQSLSECLDLSSRVVTKDGLQNISTLLNGRAETPVTLWSGTRWVDGRLFLSGSKQLVTTTLGCGVSLKTSPDHRFRVVGENGEPVWKKQEELTTDDYVLVNKRPIEGTCNIPEYNGRPLTPEVMEVLGWMIGDGTLVSPRQLSGGQMTLFYHHEKERDLWQKHAATLADFGVSVAPKETVLSEDQKTDVMLRNSFKSVADSRIKNVCYDTAFVRWLEALGFRSSADGKVVPSRLHVLPVAYRQAFLRGLFSADGGKLNERGSVALTIQNDDVREGVRQMLLGLGIRTFDSTTFSHKLFIKDREEFWTQIGFTQGFKQLPRTAEQWQLGTWIRSLFTRLLRRCVESPLFGLLSKSRRDRIVSIVKGNGRCSSRFLATSMKACGVEEPAWMADFHLEPVTSIVPEGHEVEMADFEVFTDDHSFVVEGAVVHNSNNEYRLEAARDTGIRPLIGHFEQFLNDTVVPLLDPEVAQYFHLSLNGLDAETPEKESVRIQQDAPLHMCLDEIMEKVEKSPIGKEWGGRFPLNPQWQSILDKYLPVGHIVEHFFGVPNASKDPALQYRRDPFYFQAIQIQMQKDQMAAAQQQQVQAQQAPQGQDPHDAATQAGKPKEPGHTGHQVEGKGGDADTIQKPDEGEDLTRALDQAITDLGKNEAHLSAGKRQILKTQRRAVKAVMDAWETDRLAAMNTILDAAIGHAPKKVRDARP